MPGQSPPTALMCTPFADHVVMQHGGALLVGGDGGDDVGAGDRFFRRLGFDDREAAAGEIGGAFAGGRGVDVIEAQLSMPSTALKASAWNSDCAPLPMIAIVFAPLGARYFAAMAEVAACAAPSEWSFR